MLGRILKQLLGKPQKKPEPALPTPVLPENPATRPVLLQAWLDQASHAHATGDRHHAEQLCRTILQTDPGHAAGHLLLSMLLSERDQDAEALHHARKAWETLSGNADCASHLGFLYLKQGQYQQAYLVLQEAARLAPGSAVVLNNLGLACRHRGTPHKAVRYFSRAVELAPDFALARINLAACCLESDRIGEAVDHARQAVASAPENPLFRLNLAAILADSGQIDEAWQIARQLLADAGETESILRLLQSLAMKTGDWQAAGQYLERLCTHYPSPENHYNLGEFQLLHQQWQPGWQNYEKRLQMAGFPARRSKRIPVWQGEPLAGKRLYVQNEQGIGDQIMFYTCLPDLLARQASVTLECDQRLQSLLHAAFPGCTLIPHDQKILLPAPEQGFDHIVSLGSLPRWLRNSQDAFARTAFPLFQASPEKISQYRNSTPATLRRIGLCWKGGLAQTGRQRRSLSVDGLAPLPDLPGVHLISLQHDETAEETATLTHFPHVTPFSSRLHDFDEFAACLSSCDAIVTVCCSVAHFAGALALPAFVLTPKGTSWRYGADGTTMPWYPSVRLFRCQDETWAETLEAVCAALQQLFPETRK